MNSKQSGNVFKGYSMKKKVFEIYHAWYSFFFVFFTSCTFLRFLTAAEAMKAIKLFAAEYKVKPAMSKKRNCTQNERDNTKDMEMSPTDSPVNGNENGFVHG